MRGTLVAMTDGGQGGGYTGLYQLEEGGGAGSDGFIVHPTIRRVQISGGSLDPQGGRQLWGDFIFGVVV